MCELIISERREGRGEGRGGLVIGDFKLHYTITRGTIPTIIGIYTLEIIFVPFSRIFATLHKVYTSEYFSFVFDKLK